MAIEKVREYFKSVGMEERIREFPVSSATVILAAQALGTQPERIAKTMSFYDDDGCLLVVTAGDTKIDNHKFKEAFGFKAKMLSPADVESMVGHAIGGVCPFAVNDNVKIYLDESLKRFETVFPACGSSNSAVELTCGELEKIASPCEWTDVCKIAE